MYGLIDAGQVAIVLAVLSASALLLADSLGAPAAPAQTAPRDAGITRSVTNGLPRESVGVVRIAHRGGIVPGTPENTLAAFRQAIAQGAHVIEIDLRGTRDGAVVVMHDETVDRTTSGRGRVSDLTLAEVQALDAGNGQRVPTYEDVLQLVTGTGVQLLLDIKQGPSLDKRRVVELTHQHHAALDVIVGPRSLEDLRAFQALDPKLRTLGFIATADDIEPFAAAGVHIIRLWPDWIARDPGLIARVHRLGRPVWVTAGEASAQELQVLLARGVNGILTDYPGRLTDVLAGPR